MHIVYQYRSSGSVPCKPPKPQNSLLSQRPLGEEGLKQLLDEYPHLKAEFQGYSGVGDLEFKVWGFRAYGLGTSKGSRFG